jgi:hypothetical protein
VAGKKQDQQPLDQGKALTALLALVVADREERLAASADGKDTRKTELILSTAGLQANEIAPLVGKNLAAVQKAIQRSRGSAKRTPKAKG